VILRVIEKGYDELNEDKFRRLGPVNLERCVTKKSCLLILEIFGSSKDKNPLSIFFQWNVFDAKQKRSPQRKFYFHFYVSRKRAVSTLRTELRITFQRATLQNSTENKEVFYVSFDFDRRTCV